MDADATGSQFARAGEPSALLRRDEPTLSSRQVPVDAELPNAPPGRCPPHRWGCPVVMKLDPEHVAWTCGWCGLIATSDDLGVRPA
jgi:hypothetical protein